MTAGRAVLDPNVLISALLSPSGRSAALVGRWLAGEFELVVSEKLLAELRRALAYPKLRSHISDEEAAAFIELLGRTATSVEDPATSPRRSRDPGDDYILALAEASAATVVTGDDDLLVLADVPVLSPAAFLDSLASR
ncbi:MAG: putative toxin-antitoxin system toxin component, PIN family [Chloroflexi bacterium]|nr:putative toxin-antitoxin system toxin component, PIN family [Chloroflexota bacterium]